jgi:hypothetical protein
MNRNLTAVPLFDKTQNPDDWINAIQVNALLAGLNVEATLNYAKLMLSTELRAPCNDANPATMDALRQWLNGQVQADVNIRARARQRLNQKRITLIDDLDKTQREVTNLFASGRVVENVDRIDYLMKMLPQELYWVVDARNIAGPKHWNTSTCWPSIFPKRQTSRE